MFQHKSHLTLCDVKSFLIISRVLWKYTLLAQKSSVSKPVVGELVSQFLINLHFTNHSQYAHWGTAVCYSQHTGIWKSFHNTNLTDDEPYTSFYFLWSGNCTVQVLAEAHDLSLLWNIQTASGAQSAHYSLEIRGSFPRIELPRNEGKHSSTSSDEFKNEWNKAPTPPTWQHRV
jgi:hypothetical protein